MVLDLCGGRPPRPVAAGIPEDRPGHRLPLERDAAPRRPRRAARGIGDPGELGFHVSGTGDRVKVAPPSWRPDIEGKADLVEEIIRIHGVDKIAPKPLPRIEARS